jgi:hypothetical protein
MICRVFTKFITLLITTTVCLVASGIEIKEDENGILISNGKIKTFLDRKKNYCITGVYNFNAPESNLVSNISLFFTYAKSGKSLHESNSACQVETKTEVTESDGETTLIVREAWPEMRVLKKLTFYPGAPFFRLKYNIKITKGIKAKRIVLKLTTSSFMNLCCHFGENFLCRKNSFREKWFSIPRNDIERWISFRNESNGASFSVIGANLVDWLELPSRILASELKNGGFSVEFTKNIQKEFRVGDKLNFDYFIFVFNAGCISEKSSDALKTISPQE